MLKNSVSRFITMNMFGSSQAYDTKRIISDIYSNNKSILNYVELGHLKNYTVNFNAKTQSWENNIQTNNCENRMSKLFNDCAETSTANRYPGA